jgi:hypothetical protein
VQNYFVQVFQQHESWLPCRSCLGWTITHTGTMVNMKNLKTQNLNCF